jgi:hypothetical protein
LCKRWFVSDKGKEQNDLENEINDWLEKNAMVKVANIKQLACITKRHTQSLFISIRYHTVPRTGNSHEQQIRSPFIITQASAPAFHRFPFLRDLCASVEESDIAAGKEGAPKCLYQSLDASFRTICSVSSFPSHS